MLIYCIVVVFWSTYSELSYLHLEVFYSHSHSGVIVAPTWWVCVLLSTFSADCQLMKSLVKQYEV